MLLPRPDRTSIHVHRIEVRLIRLLRALERFLEFFFEDAAAVLLAFHLLVESFRGLALLRFEIRDHRFERESRFRFFRLVQKDLAARAIHDDHRLAARADDFEVFHKTYSSACARSSIRSCGCSRPIDSLNRFWGMRDLTPSLDARCSMRLSTPPRDVARVKIRVLEVTDNASSRPPLTRIDIIPPKSDI